jgi:hypothetical protein
LIIQEESYTIKMSPSSDNYSGGDFMGNIQIITTGKKRMYPAKVYNPELKDSSNHITEINQINNILKEKKEIYVISKQYDRHGIELGFYKDTLAEKDINSIMFISEMEGKINLNDIITLSEAAEKWGLADGSTIRKAIERDKFEIDEIKQAGSVWITTYDAMERVFGRIKNEEENYIIDYEKLSHILVKTYITDSRIGVLQHVKNNDSETQNVFDHISNENNDMHNEIINIFINAKEALKQDRKVIIKKVKNNKILQVINTEKELINYIDLLDIRRQMTTGSKNRLLEVLR